MITSIGFFRIAILAAVFILQPAYPLDGYEESGIRRLLWMQRVAAGETNQRVPVPGALKSIEDIKLQVPDHLSADSMLVPDPTFTRKINSLFPGLDASYSVAILDISEGYDFRYAERKGNAMYQPGSVGKVAVAVAFFAELAKIYPDDFESRLDLMRSRFVKGGQWVLTDEHTVPFYNPDTGKFFKRTVQEGDVFSLFEWLDHMLSVSNNGAASVVWREAVLMRAFGADYADLTPDLAEQYFKDTPKVEMTDIAISVVNDPLRELGIGHDEWRLGTFFTRGAGRIIPGKGGSTGTVRGLMKFLVLLEQGKVVDEQSSLEIKRLMYMTDRRIRYAASGSLASAAVYFKSGSLYSCRPEEGYSCGKYKGNKSNFMNSVAIIEHDDGTNYLVVLMSNVLKKNSASDHMALASTIERAVRNR